jgi:hypothetical protein
MERSKAIEATRILDNLESAERFLDEVTSTHTITDLPDDMYDALKCFAKDWVEKYKQELDAL